MYIFKSMSEAIHSIFTFALVGVVSQSVERATPGEEVQGLIVAVDTLSPLVGSVSALSHVWQQVKLSDAILGPVRDIA